jgi:hypothetical protein
MPYYAKAQATALNPSYKSYIVCKYSMRLEDALTKSCAVCVVLKDPCRCPVLDRLAVSS